MAWGHNRGDLAVGPIGRNRIKDVFIIPNIADGSATFNLELQNTGSASKSVQLVTMIRRAKDPDRILVKSVRAVSLRPGVSKHTETIHVPDAQYWSPDDPHLYQADAALAGSDYWTSRFGMREFTIRNRQFHLNGKPIYLKATFFESLYPTRIAYPDSREMAAREIQLAKDAGFNMIRPWRRIQRHSHLPRTTHQQMALRRFPFHRLATRRVESGPITDGSVCGPRRSRPRSLDVHSAPGSQASDLCRPSCRRHDARHLRKRVGHTESR